MSRPTGDEETERTKETERDNPAQIWILRSILPGDSKRVVLRGASFVLGRGDECAVQLTHSRVSRRHAEIYRQGPVFAFRDLGSTNGTYADGRRVEHCAVRSGLVIRIGDWLGIIQKVAEASEYASTDGFTELASGLFGGAEMAIALRAAQQAARADLPLEIVGETGTGKELLARAFHDASGRPGPFHALNCAALPATLAEAELFGYRRGAFTGAEKSHLGQFRAAHGGTLFLDEVAELGLELQAKLLRALERKEVTPLGETRLVGVDARVAVASQRPLATLVDEGRFREDLAARLSGMTVVLPPLRERKSDIPSLFAELARRRARTEPARVATKLYERLCLYNWPGNVRELELLASNMLARYDSEPILRRRHLPDHLRAEDDAPEAPVVPASRRDHDRKRLARALETTGGNLTRAAEIAGISRQRAYRIKGGGFGNGKP
jgi:sigma-54 dependent transcriptional regulator, acetoin dehydrogenase operon transcriptional activator AcoR